MSASRSLIFPGLVPLSLPNLEAVVGVDDGHLSIAAHVCGVAPADAVARYGANLPQTLHEALLAVAVIRRMEKEPLGWTAFGGLSAGVLPALYAAGAIAEEDCFRLAYEINSSQLRAGRQRRSGTTIAALTSSEGDAERLVEVLGERGYKPHLSVDLGGGLVAVALPTGDPLPVTELLHRLGIMVLDSIDRAEHCPFALPRKEEFRSLLDTVEFRSPTATVISPLTGECLGSSPDELKHMLVEQWFDTARLPKTVDGLLSVSGVKGVDLVSPESSVYVSCTRNLLRGRADHRLLTLPG
ncbi:hypothetical protein GCM10009799_46740 [Nocardiopsis rhodophaea]|uniref:[acyl-carrier-protein] S-malonyltransferase n=1 Tax=Nocardiopsis rhodophaea TaxID=280238 RepID=A0ABP5F3Z5_9ACTN